MTYDQNFEHGLFLAKLFEKALCNVKVRKKELQTGPPPLSVTETIPVSADSHW